MATGAERQRQALAIHERLLHGDPTASLDASDLLLDALVARLRTRWPRLAHTDACHDAAVEVFVMYLQAPDRYDPTRSSLLGWLAMQAHGDLLNEYTSKQKGFERGWLVESEVPPKSDTGDAPRVGDQVRWFDKVPDLDGSTVLNAVRNAFPDERDRRLVWLMCIDGSRSTEEAAAILGLEHLQTEERVATVKRHKDRVMRRLRRLGLENRDE